MTIYDYAKQPLTVKEKLLLDEAHFLEKYSVNDHTVCVYYLAGFFVELTIKEGKTIDIVPYKRGYKLNKNKLHEIEKRNMLYGMAA